MHLACEMYMDVTMENKGNQKLVIFDNLEHYHVTFEMEFENQKLSLAFYLLIRPSLQMHMSKMALASKHEIKGRVPSQLYGDDAFRQCHYAPEYAVD